MIEAYWIAGKTLAERIYDKKGYIEKLQY